ncbi:hypothetical protein HFO09_23090 [Rhizobium laguerreae]|uniref:hypothetical protein n=1 Tax=Rhizobium laguerreae TaxID=1076926 RepID=UPI001C8FAAC2|nr:hypothetical protein [Rhizobium laguerreae]MBY3257042.1 hypothetical protein [Rhizobium laguerreae]MBY3282403.1 hypothetical protein [Rhizobium laguerreae]MBY3291930.1 hypothetical protein [Rhizobium laguerreae]
MISRDLLATSIDLNGLFYPARGFDSVLAKYVDILTLYNDDPIYKVSIRGSATPLRYKNRFFLACCLHQLAGRDFTDVAMLKSDGSQLVTSAGVRSFISRTESDYSDLVIFDFTEPCLEHVDLQSRFFHFREIPPDAANTETIFVQVNGYPSSAQDYELEDKNHLGLRKRKVLCSLDGQPSDHALLRLKTYETLDFDPDGMSGGSAFTVQHIAGKPTAFFAGMIMRGGREHIHILKSGYIKAFLDEIASGARLDPER